MATEPRAGFCPTEAHCGRAHLPDVWRGLEQHEPIKAYSSEVGEAIAAGVAKTTCVTMAQRVVIGG